jgi:hypothetical protein
MGLTTNAGVMKFTVNGAERIRIANNGNVGINNTSPNLTLDVGSTNGNHNIGRAILTAGNIHAADKLDFLSIGRWDGGSTADMQFSGIKYGVITAAAAGEGANNHTCMTFHTWGNSIWNTKEVMRLTSRGRLGINTTTPTELLDVNGNIKCTGTITNGSNSYIYAGGLRLGGFDTGNTLWQNSGNLGISANTGNNITFAIGNGGEKMRVSSVGRVGISNSDPQSMLHLGNCTVANSAPVIVFGKKVNGTGYRNAFMGYTDNFFFVIGDYGNTNTGSNALTSQLAILYSAPASSFVITKTGYCQMQYGYGQSSDERIKTNIKTIENALEKTLLLRGVEYNDFRIEPEKKRIGVIAQEDELIIHEVVGENEMNEIKCISYGSMVGLLVEAIKQLNNKVINLENVLKNNNLN